MSSKSLPLIIFFGAIIVVLGGVLYIYKVSKNPIQTTNNSYYHTAMQTVSPTPTITGNTNSSNDQLSKDSQSIDDSMHQLDTDLSTVNQGLNDQATNLQ